MLRKGFFHTLVSYFLFSAFLSIPSISVSKPLPEMKNPLEGNKEAIEQGRKLWFMNGCNGCHGGTGGGGMCPPVINKVWVYGDSDAVLFNLIKLGSVGLRQEYGLTRVGKENVVGDMPPFPNLSDDDIWKLIAFIRSIYKGK